MCELCDEFPQGIAYCPFCGRMICYDTKSIDDICAPASATSSGDLACLPCAQHYDRIQEEQDALEWGHLWEHYPGEMIAENLDFGEEAR